jgi:hypothetical protein
MRPRLTGQPRGDEDANEGHGSGRRAHEGQVTVSATAELLVPRLRGVSHAFAFLLSVAAAVVLVVLASPGRATVAAMMYGAG